MDEPQLAEIEEEMPKPTIWPAALAVGLVAACFGMLTVGIFFYAGVILVAIAVWGWMRELIAASQRVSGLESHVSSPAPDPRPETRDPRPQAGGLR
jgi:uncharacterized membrane protein YjjP (DUF1212 family)